MNYKLIVETADPAQLAQIVASLPKTAPMNVTQSAAPAQQTAVAAQMQAVPSTPAQPLPSAPTLGRSPSGGQMFPPIPNAPAPLPGGQPLPSALPTAVPNAPAPLPQASAPTYSVQQLSLAARPLVEMGRQQELMGLLAEFGAPSVAELPENQRGAFAAKLRAMGGQI